VSVHPEPDCTARCRACLASARAWCRAMAHNRR
jgi:hypothetical protein